MSTITARVTDMLTIEPPNRQEPSTFEDRTDIFLNAFPNFGTELNTISTQMNTVAGEVNTNAGIATTQAGLATTNGAAQVTLAATQAGLAETAKTASEAARDLSLAYSQSVATLVDGTINDSLVSTTTTFSSSKIKQLISTYSYDDRSDLRSLTPTDNDTALVDGLGLFVFKTSSDEPDDDESCFATSTGRWLLEAAHWDLVDAWQLPEVEEGNDWREDIEDIEDITTDLNTLETDLNTHTAKTLYGTATCAITGVAAADSVSFTGTVTGVSVGDRVYVNPPAMLGGDTASTGRLSFHAYISATNTVTIYLCNAGASTATTNTAIRTAWKVIVIKE